MRLVATLSAIGLFLVDRLTKGYFLQHTADRIELVPNLLWLQYHLNDQMALSLPLFPVLYYTLVGVIIVVLCARLVSLNQQNKLGQVTVVGVLLAGAVSNLLDRLLYGGVVDFITVSFRSVFNIADIMIVGSVIAWVIILAYADRKKTIQTHN